MQEGRGKWQIVKHNLRYFKGNENSIHIIKTITKSYSDEKPVMCVRGVLTSPLHGLPAQESHHWAGAGSTWPQAKAGLA